MPFAIGLHGVKYSLLQKQIFVKIILQSTNRNFRKVCPVIKCNIEYSVSEPDCFVFSAENLRKIFKCFISDTELVVVSILLSLVSLKVCKPLLSGILPAVIWTFWFSTFVFKIEIYEPTFSLVFPKFSVFLSYLKVWLKFVVQNVKRVQVKT